MSRQLATLQEGLALSLDQLLARQIPVPSIFTAGGNRIDGHEKQKKRS